MTGQQTRVNGSSTMEMGNSNQELLSGGKKGKVTLIVIGLVIIITLGVLIFFVFSGSHSEPKTSPLVSPVRSLSVLDVVDGRYIGERFNGSWISDYEILFRDESGNIILFNAATKSKKVLLPDLTSIAQTAFSYELSADKRFLLVGHSYHRLYRHSYLAHYVIVNLKTKQMLPISDPQGNPRQLQLVVWAPVGNALAYVFMNDIYYWPSVELNAEEVRITRNGRTNTIHNGVPDWVYEEEVFSSNSAMWFSNDASKLAFVTFNDTTTQVMSIPYYGQPGNFAFQYTQMVNIRYPKPGRPNPEVTLNVVDLGLANLQLGAPHLINIPPPTDLMRTEPIISTVAWATNSDITVNWMNRVQNKAHTALCSTINETCKIVMTIEEPVGWIELFTAPIFSSDGTKMVLIYSAEEGNDRFRHVVLVDLQSGDLKRIPLTHGKFSVTDLLSWDEANHEIYFLSTAEGVTSHLRISKVSDSIENAPHHAICVSCDILTLERKKCTYSGASFSKKSSYYAQTCAGPDVPEIRLFEKGGKELMVWENNEGLKNALSEVTLPVPKEFKVPIAGGFEAIVKLLLPPNMDTTGKTKYPLLIQVYGGPDSNLVTDRFGIDWHTYLTVNRSVIVGFIDGRNSGLRGDNLRFAGYRNLGTVEVEDTIYVTKYLQDNFNYIDKNRTAVWGWSYGGYTTIMALGNDTNGIFKCGIAVAPVVDWIYYDSIYTERFMGLPSVEDNLKGYINAAVFNRIENFKHKNFFLVHGTLDDNVHYQQSMMLAKVLEQNDILFRQQSYPDEEHGLNGVKPHLYHSLEQFLMDECYMIH